MAYLERDGSYTGSLITDLQGACFWKPGQGIWQMYSKYRNVGMESYARNIIGDEGVKLVQENGHLCLLFCRLCQTLYFENREVIATKHEESWI